MCGGWQGGRASSKTFLALTNSQKEEGVHFLPGMLLFEDLIPGSIAAILWTWEREWPSFIRYYWLAFAWGEKHAIMLLWLRTGLKDECTLLCLQAFCLPWILLTSASTMLRILIPEFLISYVYSVSYAFLLPEISRAFSSLMQPVSFSLLFMVVGLFLFVFLYIGIYTG